MILALQEISASKSPNSSAVKTLLAQGLCAGTTDEPIELPIITEQLNALLATPSHPIESLPNGPEQWVSTAFTATQKSVLLVRELAEHPLQLNKNQSVPAAESLRLAELFGSTQQEILQLIRALQTAGLLRLQKPTTLKISQQTRPWMLMNHPDRWLIFVMRFITGLPRTLQEALSSQDILKNISSRPLLSCDDLKRLTVDIETAAFLGILTGDRLNPVVALLLQKDFETAAELTRAQFPATVPGVIVQPDFSVIATGPLEPVIGLELLELAQVQTPGFATTLRLTPNSLQRAISAGKSPEQIKGFLENISLTPLPQPLTFLLDELIEKSTQQPSADPCFSDSTTPLDTKPLSTKRLRTPQLSTSQLSTHLSALQLSQPNTQARTLATKLFSEKAKHPKAATLHLLELARRARSTIEVTAGIAEKTQTFLAVAVFVSEERLRALDIEREIEISLPLSSIKSVSIKS